MSRPIVVAVGDSGQKRLTGVKWQKMRPGIDRVIISMKEPSDVDQVFVGCYSPDHVLNVYPEGIIFVHAVAPPPGGARKSELSPEQWKITQDLIDLHLITCKRPEIVVTAFLKAASDLALSTC